MKRLILLFLAINLVQAVNSCPRCLKTDCFQNRCANTIFVVDCACECWRYQWDVKKATCFNCGHYHFPYDREALKPNYTEQSQRRRCSTDVNECVSKKVR